MRWRLVELPMIGHGGIRVARWVEHDGTKGNIVTNNWQLKELRF